ncbi:MAG: hypothetical protein U1E14_19050 [Geminicoccaceae bacterium]
MGRAYLAAGLAVLLAGCAAGNPPPTYLPDTTNLDEPVRVADGVGDQVLTVVGTPFYALAKGVGCVATVLVATPVAIGYGLSTRDDRALVRAELNRGVGANCGGSYVMAGY